ncbi:hypothetical protein GCM10010272_63280 [Streptomyces lateritius]|nr:hypothetical protein GCM10010272_63280 [Streptomyces lateritius]
MPAPEVSAEALAARLSAIGLTTRVLEHARHTSIEAEVSEPLPAETWRQVLDSWHRQTTSVSSPPSWAAELYGPP